MNHISHATLVGPCHWLFAQEMQHQQPSGKEGRNEESTSVLRELVSVGTAAADSQLLKSGT
jgi:hypothetical protein